MQKINETQWRRVCKESKRIEREDRKCKVEQRQTIKKNYCFSDLLGHLNPFLTFPFNSSSGLFSSFVRSFLPLLSLSLFLCAHFKPISSWEIFVVDFISTFLLLYGFCIVFIFIRNCCHYFLFGLVLVSAAHWVYAFHSLAMLSAQHIGDFYPVSVQWYDKELYYALELNI